MRILRVAQHLYPERKGGGAYHVHAMSRDQAAMGHNVTVVTISRDDTLPHNEERDGYDIVRCTPLVSPLGNAMAPEVWRHLSRCNDFDVVHAHSHLYFSTNLAAIRRRIGGAPLAITNHGLYSQNAPKWAFNLYLRSLGRWTFNRADAVLCYTKEDCERVRTLGVTARIEVVPNGVDTDRFSPAGAESEMIDHDGPVVLFVGRLVDGKRPLDALKAIEQLSGDLNVKLFIVGDGPLRSNLEARTKPDAVRFLGQVPYDSMPAIYRASDALVLPSRAEGLPRTILEAMASGVPVVVSDLEQVAPVVDGGGVTVPVGDIEGFAAGIESAIAGELGDPRSVVEESFVWSKTVEQTTALLAEL